MRQDFLHNSDNESWVDLTSEDSNASLKKSRSSNKRKKAQEKLNENNNNSCDNVDTPQIENGSENLITFLYI